MKGLMNVTKALADENRVRILLALRGRELCVCQLTDFLQLAWSTVSKHLSILKQAGLISSTKKGRWIFYSLAGGENPLVASTLQWLAGTTATNPIIKEDAKVIDAMLHINPIAFCKTESKKRVLFLCTGNSCRSQMAEGFVRQLQSKKYNVYSAGLKPRAMNKLTLQVMKEKGVDISEQKPKSVRKVRHLLFDYVITVCEHAAEKQPAFPRYTKIIQHPFEDPPQSIQSGKTKKEVLQAYRKVRDEIEAFAANLPQKLKG